MSSKKVKPRYDKWKRVKDTQVAHLAGVFDGVGSVRLRVSKEPDYALGYALRPLLRMDRPDKEDPVLGELIKYCEEHGVKYSILETGNTQREQPSMRWVVKDKNSIERFLKPMYEYLVSRYYDATIMIETVLPAVRNGEHTEKEGFYELVGISEELRHNDGKYTQDYFAEEWSLSE
jgi:hypothetical protein